MINVVLAIALLMSLAGHFVVWTAYKAQLREERDKADYWKKSHSKVCEDYYRNDNRWRAKLEAYPERLARARGQSDE